MVKISGKSFTAEAQRPERVAEKILEKMVCINIRFSNSAFLCELCVSAVKKLH
jgi:hypothetical protein